MPVDEDAIFLGMKRAILDQSYRKDVQNSPNVYGQGETGSRVSGILSDLNLSDPMLLNKQTVLPPIVEI